MAGLENRGTWEVGASGSGEQSSNRMFWSREMCEAAASLANQQCLFAFLLFCRALALHHVAYVLVARETVRSVKRWMKSSCRPVLALL